MDLNEDRVQKHVVVNTPGERREVLTERTETGPRESRVSAGTVAIIAVVVIAAIFVVVYLVNNRNANESANRNTNLDVTPARRATRRRLRSFNSWPNRRPLSFNSRRNRRL
jgi:negative regulator of sigma E activity